MSASAVFGTMDLPTHPEFRIQELLSPAAYPHAVESPALRETHISWVILTGPFAYKIKKPVRLDFIDASTLARRRYLCEEELRLNRRFAPDLYLDVVGITRGPAGLRVGGSAPAIEYAVRMLQFDPSQELHALLERGEVRSGELSAFAQSIAQFHAHAQPTPCGDGEAYRQELRNAVLGTLATLLSGLSSCAEVQGIGRLIDWTHDRLGDLAEPLRARARLGFIRECHGDLHARNIVRWKGRLTPFDCLEFDPRLRRIDVMNDAAFLLMDLKSHGRADLASEFLGRYLECTGDYAGIGLLRFYEVYRATVRAMVDAIDARPQRVQARIRTALDLTRKHTPTLIIMHGPSGSGKSWLSDSLVPALNAVRIRSDIERKRIQPRASDLYSPQIDAQTYARLAACAQSCLRAGMNTIVDAAFLRAADRATFRSVAAQLGSGFFIVSCHAEPDLLRRRIEARARAGDDPSDADAAVLERQLLGFEPLRSEERRHAVEVNTAAPDAAACAVRSLQVRREQPA